MQIPEGNLHQLFGLDYNRRLLNGEIICNIYSVQESNDINRNQLKYFGSRLSAMERNTALLQINGLLDNFTDAMEYGSIISSENYSWELLYTFINDIDTDGQMSWESIGIEYTRDQMLHVVKIAEVMACKYEVVVTNPPYMGSGGMGAKLSEYVKDNFPDSKQDLFAVFIERCSKFLKYNGYQAMITQHSWMFLTRYEALRLKLIRRDIANMVHLGARAFEEISGEVVQTVAFVLTLQSINGYRSTFVRVVEETSQQEKEVAFLAGGNRYQVAKEIFGGIPGSPIAYWIPKGILLAYKKGTIKKILNTREGLSPADHDRFVRFWFEVEKSIQKEKKWFPYQKGGTTRKWYGNNHYYVNWENDGLEIRNNIDPKTKRIRSHNYNGEYAFREGITWSAISTTGSAFRFVPEGFLFDSAGSMGFAKSHADILIVLALLNTSIAKIVFSFISPTIKFMPGHIIQVPFIRPSQDKQKVIIDLVERNISLSRADWDCFETSWDFIKHPLLNGESNVSVAFRKWEREASERFETLKANEEELNRIFIDIYNLQEEVSQMVEVKDVTVHSADLEREIRSFISFAVGCIFGRYSLNSEGLAFAGGDWDNSKYITFVPDKDNIIPICDDEYFDDDIVERFVTFVKAAFGEHTLKENLKFIATTLGGKGNSSREIIRNYFLKEFFKDHCQIYQKRPIYWLFDSGKQNGFKALVYMHRYDENTIGNLRIDYLHRLQRIYENEIARMQDTIENSRDAREVTAATKRKEKLIKQLQETKEYDEKIAHLALARTSIDLDDGVKVNYEKVQTDRDGKKLDVLAKI